MPKTKLVTHLHDAVHSMTMLVSPKNSSTQEQTSMPKTTMATHQFIDCYTTILKITQKHRDCSALSRLFHGDVAKKLSLFSFPFFLFDCLSLVAFFNAKDKAGDTPCDLLEYNDRIENKSAQAQSQHSFCLISSRLSPFLRPLRFGRSHQSEWRAESESNPFGSPRPPDASSRVW